MLLNPYLAAALAALATALVAYLYARTLDKKSDEANKAFFKTLAAGLVGGGAVTWLLSRGGGGGGEAPPMQPFMEPGA